MMNTHVSFHLYDLVFDNCLIIFDTRDHNETLETNEKSQPILSAAAANSVSNLSNCKLRVFVLLPNGKTNHFLYFVSLIIDLDSCFHLD